MTSNFCKTSWHPFGHTPEECPDCQLCHESKIPKKLEFRPHLTTGVIARDRDMEMLVLWLNELRDYLQAKEEASKGECPCPCHDPRVYRPHKEGHGCCDRALRTNFTHKFEPDKNGKCWCNIPKESSYHYQIDPPEHEEEWRESGVTDYTRGIRGGWEDKFDKKFTVKTEGVNSRAIRQYFDSIKEFIRNDIIKSLEARLGD